MYKDCPELPSREPFADPKLLGDLFKCQKSQKYPFRKRKGLLFPGCRIFLGDGLVRKSTAVFNVKPKFLVQFGYPEHIFHRRLSLDAPVYYLDYDYIFYVLVC